MPSYNKLIHDYRKLFIEKGLYSETVKAFIFELCNEEKVNLYLELDNEVKPSILEKFNQGINRLLDEEPLNYVLGYSYFYGYKMIVNKDVLIPRYETEELVGLILNKYDTYFKGKKINLCDVGTGSGAIAIALKKEEDNLNVFASDISEEAILVAKQNALNNEADIKFITGSMLEPYYELEEKFDILVSNPPYIKEDEVVEHSVVDYEPNVALFGGKDGLKFYRDILANAHKILKDDALIFFEMGYDQKENLTELALKYFPDAQIEVFKDINNKNRMFFLKFHKAITQEK